MKKPLKKIVVGMSGGVDSSVALLLLKEQGWDPIGVSLKYAVWENKRNALKENICCSKESFERAKSICEKIGADYHILDFSKEFKKNVIGYFKKLLQDKQTPNPCLICNQDLKFKKLFEFADKNKIEYTATGHYVRIKKTGQDYQLLKAKDKNKDQSYFLCLLNQKQLKRLVFPLGDMLKSEVYQKAKNYGFDYFLKTKQSQDLCFVSGKSMQFFLEKEIGRKPGEIHDTQGNVLGQHQGLHFYTIGQRKGIEIAQGPWYVADFDRKNNVLIITKDSDDPRFSKKEVIVASPHFISGHSNKKPLYLEAKIRYNQPLKKAVLHPPKGNISKLIFNQPQKAVTPGQWAVFYQKNACLGGGIIKNG